MTAPFSTIKDQLWSVDGLGFPASYYFMEQTGGEAEQEHLVLADGGNVQKEAAVVDSMKSDLVLVNLYRAGDHRSLINGLWLRTTQLELIPVTLKQMDCDADKVPIGTVETIAGYLKKVKRPEFNRNGKTESKAEFTFTLP